LSRISLAFKSFFGILFGDGLPSDVAAAFGYIKESAVKPAPPPAPVPEVRASDGAIQILSILQRDARLVDFLMEDISGYSDDQVGAAVRSMQESCRDSLNRYFTLKPVVDGVEGTPAKIDTKQGAAVKLLGNVPADGRAAQGILRHKGWRAERVDLPKPQAGQAAIVAPAEIEIE
jgi:hypothetical protein